MFLKNCWYVAAWAKDVGRELLGRTYLSESVCLYRKEDGTPVAIGDRCPHRFAPLHLGQLKGDVVECPYHGLQFDCSGKCSHNPHGDGKIPAAAKVRQYTLAERHSLLWIWMGDPERADAALIPDYSFLTDTRRTSVGGTSRWMRTTSCHRQPDGSAHGQFLHASYVQTNARKGSMRSSGGHDVHRTIVR
jgi:vanillate O-demethylase monooxygenase subunit